MSIQRAWREYHANFGYDWKVHPAFRWALQPDNIEDIFAKLQLSSDEI